VGASTDGDGADWLDAGGSAEQAGGGRAWTSGAEAPADGGLATQHGIGALPEGWTEHYSRSKSRAYFRHEDGRTSWTRPGAGE
jgi:hypothetical protein